MATLYEAIRHRISQSFFSRTRIDEKELLHVLFLNIVDKFYPPTGSDEFTAFLNQEIANTIREFKRGKKTMRDIDDVDPDEGPAYDAKANTDEEEFEEAFERFCDAQDEPKRSVYRHFRTHKQYQLAEMFDLPLKTVSKIVKRMPNEFQKFLKKFQD